MSEFQSACYSIAPEVERGTERDLLTLRRYYCACLIEGDNFPGIVALSRHFATYGAALLRLPECLKERSNAQVTSVLLAFDPDDDEQMEAYRALVDEAEQERGMQQ